MSLTIMIASIDDLLVPGTVLSTSHHNDDDGGGGGTHQAFCQCVLCSVLNTLHACVSSSSQQIYSDIITSISQWGN